MKSSQTILVNQLNSNVPGFNAEEVNGVLHFTIDRGNNIKEYWKTDGTPKGTVFIAKM